MQPKQITVGAIGSGFIVDWCYGPSEEVVEYFGTRSIHTPMIFLVICRFDGLQLFEELRFSCRIESES